MAAANSKGTANGKPRGKPFVKGKSGNPAGRPKDGESWAGVLKEIANKNAEELAELFGNTDLGKQYKLMPKGVQMKYLVGGRVLAALMFEPTSGLFNSWMDRSDGKVPDTLNHNQTLDVSNLQEILAKVYAKRPDPDSG